jgi:hypothetical protein
MNVMRANDELAQPDAHELPTAGHAEDPRRETRPRKRRVEAHLEIGELERGQMFAVNRKLLRLHGEMLADRDCKRVVVLLLARLLEEVAYQPRELRPKPFAVLVCPHPTKRNPAA